MYEYIGKCVDRLARETHVCRAALSRLIFILFLFLFLGAIFRTNKFPIGYTSEPARYLVIEYLVRYNRPFAQLGKNCWKYTWLYLHPDLDCLRYFSELKWLV